VEGRMKGVRGEGKRDGERDKGTGRGGKRGREEINVHVHIYIWEKGNWRQRQFFLNIFR
jgi:hypothetical protein